MRAAAAIACVLVALLSISTPAAAGRFLDPKVIQAAQGYDVKRTSVLPVVLWHGMGDSCCASYSIGAIKKRIEDTLGVFVYSIATGDGAIGDVWSSYFGNVNDQVAKVCAQLRSVPELRNGYNAVGFSQGGQFMRAVVQRCQHLGPRAHTLITMGAQHQGVANIPGCSTVPTNLTAWAAARGVELSPQQVSDLQALQAPMGVGSDACATMQSILGRGAYLMWVRDHLVQAQYFKDPHRIYEYLAYNIFLPDINNEKDEKNEQYAINLASLEQLVLYRFIDDNTVEPPESAWFGFLDKDMNVVPMREQDVYKEDWVGLKRLDQSGRLQLVDAPGEHMQFTLPWFEEHVIRKWLAGDDSKQDAARE